jgi:hypothetical protein
LRAAILFEANGDKDDSSRGSGIVCRTDATGCNNDFRDVVLAYLSPERLMMIYDKKGLEELVQEVSKLRRLKLI